SGLSMSPERRSAVDSLLERLEAAGAAQQPRPIENPLLWGNYNVAYTSVGKSQENGQPAGGRFRGRIGRTLFRTAGLFQSVLQPDIATNKVEFRLFGCIPGYVGLRGKVVPQGEGGDTVAVLFEPPVLCVANSLHLRIGRPSSVVLSTTYLDERVRLGKGSRGSLFVFTRGGAAETAGMDQVGLQKTTFTAAALFTAFFVSLFAGGAALWVSGFAALKAAALAMWLLGAAIGGVVRQGGLVMDSRDERMVAAVKADVERKEAEQAQRASGGGGGAPAAA
ncbi:putative plastid-lipid-associated protein 8, chloroplastic, partial [Tetrabaena socialis]